MLFLEIFGNLRDLLNQVNHVWLHTLIMLLGEHMFRQLRDFEKSF